jgi:dihydrofolate reductase
MSSSSCRVTEFKMIVALCRGGGIGYKGTLPWPKIERDLRFFSQMTRSSVFPYNSAVVMGRKTWESIPANVQPLPFRDNFVVSALHDADSLAPSGSTGTPLTGVTFIKNLSEMHNYAMNYDHVWFIGGASMSGGVGKIIGVVVGALIMGVMNNGMSILGIGIDYQQVIKGLVLLAAVIFDVYNKNK